MKQSFKLVLTLAQRLAEVVQSWVVISAGQAFTVELVSRLQCDQPLFFGHIVMMYPISQGHFVTFDDIPLGYKDSLAILLSGPKY